jgi:isopropylmalate/homocitrate/citramalate synthase
MTKTAMRTGAKQGMTTVNGNGRRINITAKASAIATKRRIAINLADHFKLSRLIFKA